MTRMFRPLIGALLVAAAPALTGGEPQKPSPLAAHDLAPGRDAEQVSPPLPPLLDHEEVERRLQAVGSADPNRFVLERVGASLEGRAINLIPIGSGPLRVLLWSQMHGDEPPATAALFDVFDY